MAISPFSILFILILGVLIFGKNLPGVARQIGLALMEFRKGLDEWKEVHHRPAGTRGSKPVEMQEEPMEQFESLGTKFDTPRDGSQQR